MNFPYPDATQVYRGNCTFKPVQLAILATVETCCLDANSLYMLVPFLKPKDADVIPQANIRVDLPDCNITDVIGGCSHPFRTVYFMFHRIRMNTSFSTEPLDINEPNVLPFWFTWEQVSIEIGDDGIQIKLKSRGVPDDAFACRFVWILLPRNQI